jgi:hypothetical protein
MSYGGLPFWVYAVDHERFLAECTCCFNEEWHSGYSKEIPMYVQNILSDFGGEEKESENT